VIHGVALEQLLPLVRNYPLFQQNPMIGAGIVAILTGTGLYSFVVAIPTALYMRMGWKLIFPRLDFSGAWLAEIHDQIEVCAPPEFGDRAPPTDAYLCIVDIEQTLFQISVHGFNERLSSFWSSIAGISPDGQLQLVYLHKRLVAASEKLPTDTEGVDNLMVAERKFLGKPLQLQGIWMMCAIPKTRLYRGSSKYIRITKAERAYLKASLNAKPGLTLVEFMNWRNCPSEKK